MKKIKIMCAIMLVAMFFVVSAGEAKESSEDICGQKVKKGGKVFVDYVEEKNKSKLLEIGSLITIRGFGKYKLFKSREGIRIYKNTI